jgi:hypothetical protein
VVETLQGEEDNYQEKQVVENNCGKGKGKGGEAVGCDGDGPDIVYVHDGDDNDAQSEQIIVILSPEKEDKPFPDDDFFNSINQGGSSELGGFSPNTDDTPSNDRE